MSDFLESWEDKNSRIIVFAGVFDPVHKGHLSAAEEALFYGSKVLFMPERVPQHKHGTTAYEHRFTMLQIATANNPAFEVVDYPRDHQWIRETFEWLSEKYQSKNFVWLVGSDVAPFIHTWPDSDKLVNLGVQKIVVMKRDALKYENSLDKIHDVSVAQLKRRRARHEHLSSSYIREDLKHRHTALPDGVYAYIRQNGLYEATSK